MTNEKNEYTVLPPHSVLCFVSYFALHLLPYAARRKNSKTLLPEVRNNGTAIQWRDTAEEEWHDLVALNTLRGTDGKKRY